MSGTPGTKEEARQTARWKKEHVRSEDSPLVKKLRAYLPESDDEEEHW